MAPTVVGLIETRLRFGAPAEAPAVAVVAEPCPNLCQWYFGLRTYRGFSVYIYIYTHTHTLSIQAHYLPSACSVKFGLLCCMPESCVNLCRPGFSWLRALGVGVQDSGFVEGSV